MRERHPVDVTAVARRVCEDLAPVALSRKQEIEFDAPDVPPCALGQSDLIEVDRAVRQHVHHLPARRPQVHDVVDPNGRSVHPG